MQGGERPSEATGAGIYPLVKRVGAAKGITYMAGTLTALTRGGVVQTTLGSPDRRSDHRDDHGGGGSSRPRQRGPSQRRRGYADSTRMSTAGRVRNSSTYTGDCRGRGRGMPD